MLKILFMGTPDFAVPALVELKKHCEILAVYTQPDKPVGRGQQMAFSPVKKKALEFGLEVFQPQKLSTPECYEHLKSLNSDAMVVVAYGQILRKNVLDLPRLGCINIHSSLLPRWRGAAPIQWAILAGDPESGITTMKMVEKLDAGDIYLQKKTPISAQDAAGALHDRLALMGAELIVETLDGLHKGSIKGTVQDESLVTYASKLTKEMEWLQPSETAVTLDRRVRALNPWPGTSVQIEAARLKVKAAKPWPEISGSIGQIFEKAGMLLLGTASGSLELLSVQWDGKKQVTAAEFLNGLKGNVSLKLPLKVTNPL